MPMWTVLKLHVKSGGSNHWMIIGALRLPAFYATDIATGKGKQLLIYVEIYVKLLGCGLRFKDQFPVEVH